MITLEYDSRKLKHWLNSIETRQLPYAESVALNNIAFRVQRAVRANLRKKFTLRNNWTEKGIQVNKATKYSLYSTVGTRDEYLAKHEEGGIFRTKSGKSWSIPLKDIRRNKKGIVTKSKWPGRLRNKKNRVVESRRGKGKILLQMRKKQKPLLLYAFEKQIKIKPKLDFEKTAESIGSKYMQLEFQIAFDRAMRTAR
ncbi:MAG: hypothetical protein KDK36_00685 [Leptospiraceae bacterium]|nr:hypothetical protein [Leptospiraceae bacterium]